MNKIIQFPAMSSDEETVYENIPADVAIAHDGDVTFSGLGSIDAYRIGDLVGLSINAHTGLSLYASLTTEEAEKLARWILTGERS